MNIFEGARRISVLITGLITIGFVIAGFNISPTVDITYDIILGTNPSKNTSNICAFDDGAYATDFRTTKSGTKYLLRLCFLPITFSKGQSLVPYKIDADEMVWGDKNYSTNVVEYTGNSINSFSVSEADEAFIDKQWRPLFLGQLFEGFIAFLLTIACFWFFVIAVGWIVRGFMGVPRGQDKKPIQ